MKKLSIFLLTSILLISTSCRNVFYQAQLDSIDVAEEELQEEKEEKKFYTVTGTVGINLPENNARTAMPAVDLTSSSFSSLSYTVEAENQSDSSKVTGEITISATEVKYKIYLSDGTWKLNIKAYADAAHTNQVFAGSTVFTIESLALSSGSTSVNLTGVSSGTGTVTLPVKIAADSGITSGKAVWTVGGVDKEEILTFDIVNSVFEDSFNLDDGSSNVPAGAYTVRFIFYKGPTVAYSFVETINVFNGLETNKWLNSTSAVYLTGNSVLITKALVQSYALKTFYVDPVNGSDSESGDFFFPLSSVQRAVNMIEAVNDGVSEYNIILMGNVEYGAGQTLTTDSSNAKNYVYINPTSLLKLKIKSVNNIPAAINANGSASNICRVMYVGANADITLENIIIKGGYADKYGAGLYNLGKVLLTKKSAITNNVMSEPGISAGAVYNKNSTLTLTDDVEVYDNGDSINLQNGGGIYCDANTTFYMSGNASIHHNIASSGAGLKAKDASVYITGGSIYSNEVIGDEEGGAIYNTKTTETAIMEISDCKIYSNKAMRGGAILSKADLKISGNTEIYLNETTSTTGTLCIYDGLCDISGSVIIKNDNIAPLDCAIYGSDLISGSAISLKLSDNALVESNQTIYLEYNASASEKQKTITLGNLTGVAATQRFSLILGNYTSGTAIIKAGDATVDLSALNDRFTVLDAFGNTSGYCIDFEGKLSRIDMNLNGSIVHTLVLDNDIAFSTTVTSVSKVSGGAIEIASVINSSPVANLTATYENFKVEILAYGIRTGVESAPGTSKVVIPADCGWPAGKYELYITGKYQGVEYNASLYFDLTE